MSPYMLRRPLRNNAADFATEWRGRSPIFSDMFGPLPKPDFTVIQIPDGTLREFAAPASCC